MIKSPVSIVLTCAGASIVSSLLYFNPIGFIVAAAFLLWAIILMLIRAKNVEIHYLKENNTILVKNDHRELEFEIKEIKRFNHDSISVSETGNTFLTFKIEFRKSTPFGKRIQCQFNIKDQKEYENFLAIQGAWVKYRSDRAKNRVRRN